MKKAVTILLLTASLVIVLDSFNFSVIFMEFIFAGIIPGATERFSPDSMLAIVSITAGLVFGKIIIFPIIKKIDLSKTKKHPVKKHILKHA